jgi:hypothetical protein
MDQAQVVSLHHDEPVQIQKSLLLDGDSEAR